MTDIELVMFFTGTTVWISVFLAVVWWIITRSSRTVNGWLRRLNIIIELNKQDGWDQEYDYDNAKRVLYRKGWIQSGFYWSSFRDGGRGYYCRFVCIGKKPRLLIGRAYWGVEDKP